MVFFQWNAGFRMVGRYAKGVVGNGTNCPNFNRIEISINRSGYRTLTARGHAFAGLSFERISIELNTGEAWIQIGQVELGEKAIFLVGLVETDRAKMNPRPIVADVLLPSAEFPCDTSVFSYCSFEALRCWNVDLVQVLTHPCLH